MLCTKESFTGTHCVLYFFFTVICLHSDGFLSMINPMSPSITTGTRLVGCSPYCQFVWLVDVGEILKLRRKGFWYCAWMVHYGFLFLLYCICFPKNANAALEARRGLNGTGSDGRYCLMNLFMGKLEGPRMDALCAEWRISNHIAWHGMARHGTARHDRRYYTRI